MNKDKASEKTFKQNVLNDNERRHLLRQPQPHVPGHIANMMSLLLVLTTFYTFA